MKKFSDSLCKVVFAGIVIGWGIVLAGAGARIAVALFRAGWNVF